MSLRLTIVGDVVAIFLTENFPLITPGTPISVLEE
jgi:hypothetical protein